MKIFESHFSVVTRWVVLSEVVSHVGGSFTPEELKLFLSNAVTDPMEAHVEGF